MVGGSVDTAVRERSSCNGKKDCPRNTHRTKQVEARCAIADTE